MQVVSLQPAKTTLKQKLVLQKLLWVDNHPKMEARQPNVVAFATLTTLEENTRVSPTSENLEKLNRYGGKVDELLEQYGITDNKEGLTNGEINGLLQVLADTSKDRSFEAGFHRSFSLQCREIQQVLRRKTRLQEKLIPVVNRFNNLTKNLSVEVISESQKKSVISLINEYNETVVKMINSYNKESSTPEILFDNHPKMEARQPELAEKCSVSIDTIDYHIKDLKQKNKLIREGGKKGRRWIVP